MWPGAGCCPVGNDTSHELRVAAARDSPGVSDELLYTRLRLEAALRLLQRQLVSLEDSAAQGLSASEALQRSYGTIGIPRLVRLSLGEAPEASIDPEDWGDPEVWRDPEDSISNQINDGATLR